MALAQEEQEAACGKPAGRESKAIAAPLATKVTGAVSSVAGSEAGCRRREKARGTGLFESSGEGGIRTPDTDLNPYNGLANRRLQPLGHLSGDGPKDSSCIGCCPAMGARDRGRKPQRPVTTESGREQAAWLHFAAHHRGSREGVQVCFQQSRPAGLRTAGPRAGWGGARGSPTKAWFIPRCPRCDASQ